MTDLYELINGDRLLRFTGDLIAHATSRQGQDEDRIRWTEVDIYRTRAGAYVVHKVGKSDVYHAGPAMCSATGGKKTTPRAIGLWDSEARESLVPCPVCRPGSWADHSQVVVEQDRGTAHIATTARGVVESCHNSDGDGVTYLPKVAQRALAAASETDSQIRDAYLVEEVA